MKQITTRDLATLTDSTAEPADRAEVLMRLAHWDKGQHERLEGTIAGLLADPSAMVRGGAIKTLLAWGKDKYVDAAIQLLRTDKDEDWNARANAAFALASYVYNSGKQRDRIVRELVHALREDPEWPVQERCYESLLEILAPERSVEAAGEFDRDRDVDWELLRPYVS
jgi:hypothetical protein